MTLALRLDPRDPTPPYEQLRRQLATAIGSGGLAEGTRLPTVRQLASDLGVAPGTVMRAYAELDAAGLVATRRGGGTTVLAPAHVLPAVERQTRLASLAAAFVGEARLLGVSDAGIETALRDVLHGRTPAGS